MQGEHPAFSPSDFKIVGKALEIKQLTGELRNAPKPTGQRGR